MHKEDKFWSTPATSCKYFLLACVDQKHAAEYKQAFETQLAARLSIAETDVQCIGYVIDESSLNDNPKAKANDNLDKASDKANDNLHQILNQRLSEAKTAGADLFLLIIPSFNRKVYRTYKNLADRVHSLRSICLTIKRENLKEPDNLKRPSDSKKPDNRKNADKMEKYMTNVAMKVNFKLGGVSSWNKDVENLGKNTLILGADVVHPGVTAFEGCPSIASIVGSVDDSATKYLGSMRLQSKPKTDREVCCNDPFAKCMSDIIR